MTMPVHDDAFGGPGITPSFAAGDKDAVTTALGTSRVWATIGGGVLNEVFWPNTGRPQLRDLGFLVTGDDFWVEVKRVADYSVRSLEPAVPFITVVHTHERYELTLDVLCDTRRDCVLVRYELLNRRPDLGALALHVLAAPHLGGNGHDNNAYVIDGELVATRGSETLAIVCDQGFSLASAGFVGASDGWQDCDRNGHPTWSFSQALQGNVALTATCAAPSGCIAIAFATTAHGACTLARASIVEGFETIAVDFVANWLAWASAAKLPAGDDPLDVLARRSAMVLKAHEDLKFPGAIVASLATPWGFAHDDPGGYHLVWPRDCAEAGLALAAIGLFDDARRMVHFLASTQSSDGHWPQNFTPDGNVFWSGLQLDETALPVVLALKLQELGELDVASHPAIASMVRRACAYLAATGPLTMQDRWEETAGMSPFSIAAAVAALAGAAASGCLEPADARYAAALADWWNTRVEPCLWVEGTALDKRIGTAGHYVRIGSADGAEQITIANRAGETYDARELVGLEFMALVRFGLRAADDPKMVDTVKVIDAVLRQEVPAGPLYHRYQDDGYGEHSDGRPFDGSGIGRLWPLLAGERGHYAVAAGEDPRPYLEAMAGSCSRGGLLPEQVWDADDLPGPRLQLGRPTGSATPLVWAHAEFIKLHAAHLHATMADQLRSVADRYRVAPRVEIAYVRDETDLSTSASTVVVQGAAPFVLHLGTEGWSDPVDVDSVPLGLGMHGATIPSDVWQRGRTIEFTRRDAVTGVWEGIDHTIRKVTS